MSPNKKLAIFLGSIAYLTSIITLTVLYGHTLCITFNISADIISGVVMTLIFIGVIAFSATSAEFKSRLEKLGFKLPEH